MEISCPDMPVIHFLATHVARQATMRRTPSSGGDAHELGTISAVSLPSNHCREQPRQQWHLPNIKVELTRHC